MQSSSNRFSCRPKLRIALQLVLDALPALLLIAVAATVANESLNPPMADFAKFLMGVYVIGAVPMYILAIILRGRADALFKQCTWCRKLSLILRFTGAFAVSFALLAALFALALEVSL